MRGDWPYSRRFGFLLRLLFSRHFHGHGLDSFVESGGTTWIVPTFWEGVESLSYSEVALEVGRLVVSMAEIRSMPRQCRTSGH